MSCAYSVVRDFATPFVTLITAAVVVWTNIHFNRRQAQTAEFVAEVTAAKLKVDVFDRRYAIWVPVAGLFSSIIAQDDISDIALTEFLKAVADARFLLPGDLCAVLENARERALRLKILRKRLETAKSPERIDKIEDELFDIVKWFGPKQFDNIQSEFRTSMSLDIPVR